MQSCDDDDVRRRRRRLSCVPLSSSFLLSSLFFSLDFLEERKKEIRGKNEELYATLIIHTFSASTIGGGGGVTREKAKKKIGFPQFVHARARPREGKRKKGTENRSRATPGFEKKSRARRRRPPPPPPPLLI